MRNKMEQLAENLKTMYLTENPVNFTDEDREYKYFICFNNTHKIVRKTKNIADMIEELEDIIKNGVTDGSVTLF